MFLYLFFRDHRIRINFFLNRISIGYILYFRLSSPLYLLLYLAGVQGRINQSHQRGVGGFTLAPVTISAKAVSLPSPAPSPNLLEPCSRVLGDSSPVSTGSHTKPCHVDWSTIKRLFREGDVVGAFSLVLERGELEDLVRAMEVLGPRPDVSMLNILYCDAFYVLDLMFGSLSSCVLSCLNTVADDSTCMRRI
jgi:hypothetical protein